MASSYKRYHTCVAKMERICKALRLKGLLQYRRPDPPPQGDQFPGN